MTLSDQFFLHYLELPRRTSEPVKINKILERRINRYRRIRENRLMQFEELCDGSDDSN